MGSSPIIRTIKKSKSKDLDFFIHCKFEIYIDGRQVKRFSLETVNTYFINNGYKKTNNPFGKSEYWEEFWEILERTPIYMRTEYTDDEFCDALRIYRSQNISISINSENPIVGMFAILDRRVGMRTLLNVKNYVLNNRNGCNRFTV